MVLYARGLLLTVPFNVLLGDLLGVLLFLGVLPLDDLLDNLMGDFVLKYESKKDLIIIQLYLFVACYSPTGIL
jgi:hypothetical protein